MTSSKNDWFQQFKHMQVPYRTGRGVRRSERPLLACHARCNCSMETSHNSVIGSILVIGSRFGIKSNRWMVAMDYGQAIDCHLTFMREELHIAWLDPRIDHKTSSMTMSIVPWRIHNLEAYWKLASSLEYNTDTRSMPVHSV